MFHEQLTQQDQFHRLQQAPKFQHVDPRLHPQSAKSADVKRHQPIIQRYPSFQRFDQPLLTQISLVQSTQSFYVQSIVYQYYEVNQQYALLDNLHLDREEFASGLQYHPVQDEYSVPTVALAAFDS